jgi:hypothetical protein
MNCYECSDLGYLVIEAGNTLTTNHGQGVDKESQRIPEIQRCDACDKYGCDDEAQIAYLKAVLAGVEKLPKFLLLINDLAEENELTREQIKANCHSDDHAVEVTFDAVEWFASASLNEILKVAAEDWGACEATDRIAMWAADHNKQVQTMFDYVHIRNKIEDMGYSCYVDSKQAMEWLEKNRPEVHAKIEAQ